MLKERLPKDVRLKGTCVTVDSGIATVWLEPARLGLELELISNHAEITNTCTQVHGTGFCHILDLPRKYLLGFALVSKYVTK